MTIVLPQPSVTTTPIIPNIWHSGTGINVTSLCVILKLLVMSSPGMNILP